MLPPLIIAHRGASLEAPENTLAAFKTAIQLPIDFIELDVHLTADNIPVVVHDETLTRTTQGQCSLFVSDVTAKELKEFDAGSWFDPKFKNERVPTLEEVLQLDRGPIGLIIELKSANQANKNLPYVILDLLDKHASTQSSKGPICLSSFSSKVLKKILKKSTRYPVHGIASNLKSAELHAEIGIKHIALAHEAVTKKLISDYHRLGICVYAWSVDDLKKAEELTVQGIAGIYTNDPRLMLQHMGSLQA
jgi:glycerophosphoryl diester phosphodiesterase